MVEMAFVHEEVVFVEDKGHEVLQFKDRKRGDRMKRLSLIVGVLAVLGFSVASLGGPYFLGELVPSGGLWRPYVGFGYDTGWSLVSFSFTLEHALILNGWYKLEVARLWNISRTGNTRAGGLILAAVGLYNGYPIKASAGVGIIGSARWEGLNLDVKLVLFRNVKGDSVLLGLQPSFGIRFDFNPCCTTPPPGCEPFGPSCP